MERALSTTDRQSLELLAADLGRVFGTRLRGLVAYGLDTPSDPPLVHSLALVERLGFDDLAACAPLVRTWHRRGLAVPLLLEPEEFRRTLDVFPIEYGEIIARHVPIVGDGLFAGASVSAEDTRRACEQLAKSQLIHLREGFLETGGDPGAVSALVAASAAPLRALLLNIDRLTGEDKDDVADVAEREVGIPGELVREIMAAGRGTQGTIADPTALLKRYIDALERVWEYVDTWKR
ncbi:MAG TPA: hypothetical protein VF147_05265 [Vicinamibacterales bacterium]